jgi:hypothetical protein
MEHLTRNQMFDLIDGACNDTEKECIESHLIICDLCKREIELLLALGEDLNKLPLTNTSSGFTDSLMKKIISPKKKGFSFKILLYKGYYSIIVLLAAIFFYALYQADWNTLRWESESKSILNNISSVYDNTFKNALQFISDSVAKILPSSAGTAGSTLLISFVTFAVFYFVDRLVGKKIIRFLS